ncbi:MAG: hypothetical protein K1X91_12185 [Bacteriodetes bacterium]|nr:hypothetical protein [Bacteroidota bacterium]
MKFFEQFDSRLSAAKDESDVAFFYDLLLYGEFVTKLITLYTVASLNDDRERTRYRYEYQIVRANAIGEYSNILDELLTGPSLGLINSSIRDNELNELIQKNTNNTWQYQAIEYLYNCFEIFEIKIDKQPIKVALKTWFTLFSHFRNKTRGHGAPTIDKSSRACIELQNSLQLITGQFSAFKRTWVYLYQNLSGKYRVSRISTGYQNEFEFLKREKTHSYINGVYVFQDKPRLINLLFSNSEMSDFLIANGNFRNNAFESISYITDVRQEQDGTSYLQSISQLPQSHTAGTNKLNTKHHCYNNLPPLSEDYITRSTLEDNIRNLITEDNRFPVITLVGRGGIGKTTLALKVISDMLDAGKFDLILWFSSRDIDLMIDGPKPVQTKVLNETDISKEFINLCGELISTDKKPIDIFSEELTNSSFGRALYVFDNFETLSDPLTVYEWINTHVRLPNKVLITSRINRNFKADYPIEISGMHEDETRNLISVISRRFNIDTLLTEPYIESIIYESDGHPYIIKILLGELAKSKALRKIERIVADRENMLTALFKRTYVTLTASSKRVFLTLCSWNSLIPRIALEAVLWRPENEERIEVNDAIEELVKSSFIEIIGEQNDEIISVPLAAAIFGKSELEVHSEKMRILEDRNLLMEFGAIAQSNVSSGLTDKIERKFKNVARRVSNIDQLKLELPVLEYIASKFPKAYIYIVEVLEEFSEYDLVKQYLREYLKIAMLPLEKHKLWVKLAEVCELTKDWEGESHALTELINLPNVEFQVISEVANRINNYYFHNPYAKKSENSGLILKSVIQIMSNRIHEGAAIDYSRLGWLLVNNEQRSDAQDIVKKGLDLDSHNHHCLKLSSVLNNR